MALEDSFKENVTLGILPVTGPVIGQATEADTPPKAEEPPVTDAKFAKLVAQLSKRKDVKDPEALAAWIGRKMGKI